jgi:hypothetical protein
MKTPIPISATHIEARTQLEREHSIDYRESILGATVRAHCRCGWKSPWLTTGWIAQEAAGRHLNAFVEHPLENRRRFAIFRETCKECGGTGEARPARSGMTRESAQGIFEDAIECAGCYDGYLWRILDRERDESTYQGSVEDAWAMLAVDYADDPDAPCSRWSINQDNPRSEPTA